MGTIAVEPSPRTTVEKLSSSRSCRATNMIISNRERCQRSDSRPGHPIHPIPSIHAPSGHSHSRIHIHDRPRLLKGVPHSMFDLVNFEAERPDTTAPSGSLRSCRRLVAKAMGTSPMPRRNRAPRRPLRSSFRGEEETCQIGNADHNESYEATPGSITISPI